MRELLQAIEEAGWRRSFTALWALVKDPRVPLAVRLVPFPLLLYLAFPFDLIPDFIPVLGQADDIAIAAGALWVVVRFTPWAIVQEHLSVSGR